jgi:hypothetical protein
MGILPNYFDKIESLDNLAF